MLLGVLDLGTNSIHMLIVRIESDLQFRVIDRAKDMVRLGRGVFKTGRIDEASQKRALDALTAFRRLADRRGVHDFLGVATSAVREAENGGAFLQEVHETIGVQPRVISGAEEARLVFRAVQSVMTGDEEPLLVLDLGGGSAEIAHGTTRQHKGSKSLKLGVQRLENMALRRGEYTPDARRTLRSRLETELENAARAIGPLPNARACITSGSGSAALSVLRGRKKIHDDENHLPFEDVVELEEELAKMPRSKRARLAGLDPHRVDLIVGAVAFVRAFMEAFKVQRLEVSDRGLREGVVLDYIERHAEELQWEHTEPNVRRRTVLRFAERLHYDAAHAHHVAHLATQLFDETRRLHALPAEHREILEFAALLHDVGYVVGEKGHHKHSEYLIRHGLTTGFTLSEVRRIAAIARYHRKVGPRPKHLNWSRLSTEEKESVRRLSGLLRIADGLDRSHSRNVVGIRVAPLRGALRLEVKAVEPPSLELWAAKNKADLFEEVFGLPVEFAPAVATNGQARGTRPAGGAQRARQRAKRA